MTRTRTALPGFFQLRAAAAALLIGVAISSCAVSTPGSAALPNSELSSTAVVSSSQRIVLRSDTAVVLATLADTPAARQFAAQLPLRLDLRDPMGQAKSGRLPAPIDHTDAETIIDPDVGGIYYVPDRAMIAIFYDDLGQTVPPPGLVRLGSVDGVDGDRDSGTDVIEAAGNRMHVLIDVVERTGS